MANGRRILGMAVLAWVLGACGATAQSIQLGAGSLEQVWHGTQPAALAGASIDQGAVGGGDDRKDLIIGSPGNDSTLGHVFVVFGGPVRTGDQSLASADVTITGASNGDRFGAFTAAGNILNVEGTSPRNLVVGAPTAFGGRGAVYLFSAGFHSGDSLTTSAAVFRITGAAGDQLGTSLATADLNNDHYREIIIGAPGTGRVYIILGGPTLSGTRDLAVTSADLTLSGSGIGSVLAAGDVTGDGIYDLLIGRPSVSQVLLFAGRNGTLPTQADAMFAGPDSADETGTSVQVADLNADGRTDVLIGAPAADGPGDTRLTCGEIFVLWGPVSQSRDLFNADVTFYGPRSGAMMGKQISTGDINRDTPNDIVALSPGTPDGTGELLVYYGRSKSNFGQVAADGRRVVDFASEVPSRTVLGNPAFGAMMTGEVFEVTGEGARDIIVGVPGADSAAGAVFFTLSPRLRVTPKTSSIRVIQGRTASSSVVVENESLIPITWEAVSNQPWLTVTGSGSAESGRSSMLVLSVSAAGLATGTYSARVTVSSTSAHLTMFVPVTISLTVKPVPPPLGTEPTRSDFNYDGMFDILWQHEATGQLAAWHLNGTNTIGTTWLVPDRVTDVDWKIRGTGDFNQDGMLDLVWQHERTGQLALWYMDGVSVISTTYMTPERVSDPAWKIVAVADFNGDHRPDLLWWYRPTTQIAVWLMNGSAVMQTRWLTPDRVGDANWRIAAAGDLNGDGKPDLVWQHDLTGEIAVWFLDGTTTTGTAWLTPRRVDDTRWKIRAIGDVDRDGYMDLIWMNDGTGQLATWLMRSATAKATLWLSPDRVGDVRWRIAGPR